VTFSLLLTGIREIKKRLLVVVPMAQGAGGKGMVSDLR